MAGGSESSAAFPLVTSGSAPCPDGPGQVEHPFLFPWVAAILAGMAGEVQGSGLVGRAVELGRLDAVLERADRGRPQVALVAGDAGVGKTPACCWRSPTGRVGVGCGCSLAAVSSWATSACPICP